MTAALVFHQWLSRPRPVQPAPQPSIWPTQTPGEGLDEADDFMRNIRLLKRRYFIGG